MEARRIFLYLALGLILILIWVNWHNEHAPQKSATATPPAATQKTASGTQATSRPTSTPATARTSAAGVSNASTGAAGQQPGQTRPRTLSAPAGPEISVATDVLSLEVSLNNAALANAKLLKYAKTLENKQPVALLTTKPDDFLTITPRLDSKALPATLHYQAAKKHFVLAPGTQTLTVPLTWSGNGVTVIRKLVLKRGSYEVKTATTIKNTSSTPLEFSPSVDILGRNPPEAEHFWDNFLPQHWTYRGPAFYNGDYNKRKGRDLAGDPIDNSFHKGWIASVNQYFVAATIPPASKRTHYFGHPTTDDGYAVGYKLPVVTLQPGASHTVHQKLYLGPKLQGHLNQVAPGLSRTVDYGHATIISHPLFMILSFIHGILGNWGWSIVILVLLIKAVFYFPQRMSARSMAKMRKLQPRLKLLKERYKDDKQKLAQATQKLYREEGANPVSGCLPMLIQIPIFFGLFYVLIYSVELRHAPWVLWIQDLSAPDPFYILPILYAVTMLVQFRLQPQAGDSSQAKMMMIMPFGMAFLYAIFPSGLVLYYMLNTVLNIAIQWQVNHELGIPMDLIPHKKKRPKVPDADSD